MNIRRVGKSPVAGFYQPVGIVFGKSLYLAQAKAQGVSAADFVADWSPKPRFRVDFSMPAPASFQAWVQVFYDEIDAM